MAKARVASDATITVRPEIKNQLFEGGNETRDSILVRFRWAEAGAPEYTGTIQRRTGALTGVTDFVRDNGLQTNDDLSCVLNGTVLIFSRPDSGPAQPPTYKGEALANLNLVIEGVPGTGKTYVFKGLCLDLGISVRNSKSENVVDSSRAFVLNCHPSTQYEDVIEGLRPRATVQAGAWRSLDGTAMTGVPGNWQVVDGVFLRACERARQLAEEHVRNGTEVPKVAILLDELNRANVPRILGDLMTAMERSKRFGYTRKEGAEPECSKPMEPLTLPLSGRKFLVPNNLIVVATMNSVDHSVAPLDQALLRRFWRIRLEPMQADALKRIPELNTIHREVDKFDELNKVLKVALGPDGMLGHSFLFDMAAFNGNAAAIANVWRCGVAPQVIAAISAAGLEAQWPAQRVKQLKKDGENALLAVARCLDELKLILKLNGQGATRSLQLQP